MTKNKWQKMIITEQLANLGCEYWRVIHWQKSNHKGNFSAAVDRFLELLDLTISDKRWQSRLNELARLREYFCLLFMTKDCDNKSIEKLKNYFLSFALMARK